MLNPNGITEPPNYDSYKEAEDWIKNKGIKRKKYQIQKFITPI